jgi:small subunit ribosomal protein S1
VEILPGVEGLVHISELANHHVENPREIVSQGDPVNVLVLEIDGERRRLSLSLKRVEEGQEPLPRPDGGESVHATPDLRLSEEAFPTSGGAVVEDVETESVEPEDLVTEDLVTEDLVTEDLVTEDLEVTPAGEAELAVGDVAEAETEAEPEADAEAEPELEVAGAADVETDEAEPSEETADAQPAEADERA